MAIRIYTGAGDAGETSLYDGSRVRKTSARIECVGTIDELNSHLGLAGNFAQDSSVKDVLTQIQKRLFALSAELATRDAEKVAKIANKLRQADGAGLERRIDQYVGKIGGAPAFIGPGTSPGGSPCRLRPRPPRPSSSAPWPTR